MNRHRAAAEAALVAATHGTPLCRTGEQAGGGGVKHAEGRLAAIAEVQRRPRSAGERQAGTVSVARDVLVAWQDGLVVALDRGRLWPAYRRGGVEELEALVAALAGSPPMRCDV
jgi:hypothetical protein